MVVQDSEDGTQYVMTVKQKDNQGGESSKEVRFSKYTDDDKVVLYIDLTDSGGAGLPSQQYLALGSGFVVKYSVGVGTAGGGTVDGYSDLKARVIVKRGSTVISEFQDAEFVGVTAGQAYTFDASPYLKDATAYTVQVEAQATYQGGTLMKTATAKVTMVAMELETSYSAGNGLADGGYKNDVNIPFTAKGTSGAKFVSAVCFMLPDGRALEVEGECPGRIAFTLQNGDYGFGYDPLFIPDEYGAPDGKRPNAERRSYAQLTPDANDAISHRGRAMEKLEAQLPTFLG